ncbi:MAG: hypothetical protein KGM99_08175 [Burkholderiales bacterium]|nr:hypothetical protein [Burkholderiales bacterium]
MAGLLQCLTIGACLIVAAATVVAGAMLMKLFRLYRPDRWCRASTQHIEDSTEKVAQMPLHADDALDDTERLFALDRQCQQREQPASCMR